MKKWPVLATLALAGVSLCADMARPKAGKVEILPLKDVKPGMQATAWTVFQGTEADAMPVEIVGVWKNYLGPKQDVILCKLGGRGKETGVASGMSGSPVYFDGKLMGAISLRMGVFSPDAICGITPIESMLEIQEFDNSRPADARTPDKAQLADAPSVPGVNLAFIQPIDTPMMFSGFSANVLKQFEPMFSQMGVTAVQGGASAGSLSAKPAAGWEKALNPGDAVSGIPVSGDMSATGMGTVTYNDGKRVLAFGHPFYNLGPIDMPMAKSEIMMVFSSTYQPTKFGSATEVVGALKQDRYTGIMGELGAEAPTVPVHVHVRSLGAGGTVVGQKDLNFHVFVHQKRLKLALVAPRIMQKIGLYGLMRKSGIFKLLPERLRKMEQMLPASGRIWPRALPERIAPADGAAKKATVGFFAGCVGAVMFDEVNRKAAQLLAACGAEVVTPRAQTCCGAIHHHNAAEHPAQDLARRNIDTFVPESGATVDYIACDIAGCGAALREYDFMLRDDAKYSQRAKVFVSKVRDISEVLLELGLPEMTHPVNETVTYHDACHLAHAQKVTAEPRALLAKVPGLKMVPLPESDMCCGAAGTYNLTQPEMAGKLAQRKLDNIATTGAPVCATGNVGCAMHIQSEAQARGRTLTVVHPVEILHRAVFGEGK